jgi:putative hydrolase of the HAD superfamily
VQDHRPVPEDIDAVIFDAGGVLLLPDAALILAAVRALNCETRLEDWHRAHYAANQVLDRMDELHWPAVSRAAAVAAGVPDAQLDAAVEIIENLVSGAPWAPVAGAADALAALEAAGYQLAVVSNATGTIARELEGHGICSVSAPGMPRVSVVIDSHVAGIEKPDPRIFGFALDVLGADPARCLYIGDTVRFDVRGALAAGLHPVHVDPFGHCQPGEHAHISGLADLAEWLT